MQVDDRILTFLKENSVSNICLLNAENKPHCISCFYVFDEKEHLLIFKSSYGTAHDSYISENAAVAGTILPSTFDPLQIKGIQFTGRLMSLADSSSLKYGGAYAQKYPMSLALPGYNWCVWLDYIKLTDNSLGFGTKIQWRSSH